MLQTRNRFGDPIAYAVGHIRPIENAHSRGTLPHVVTVTARADSEPASSTEGHARRCWRLLQSSNVPSRRLQPVDLQGPWVGSRRPPEARRRSKGLEWLDARLKTRRLRLGRGARLHRAHRRWRGLPRLQRPTRLVRGPRLLRERGGAPVHSRGAQKLRHHLEGLWIRQRVDLVLDEMRRRVG